MRWLLLLLLPWSLIPLGCPVDDDPCHQFWVALADTFDECAETWDKTWDSTSYDDRQDFIDQSFDAVDHALEGMDSEEEQQGYFDGCQQAWDDATDEMESCDFMIYTWYFVG